MDDRMEIWSLPWHALQKSLAAAAVAAPASFPVPLVRGASWLVLVRWAPPAAAAGSQSCLIPLPVWIDYPPSGLPERGLFFKQNAALLSDYGHVRGMIAPQGHNAMMKSKERSMSSLDLDLDSQMSSLETEWRHAYETSISARAEYESLAANPSANADLLDAALERLDRAEALKARIMTRIERLESSILGTTRAEGTMAYSEAVDDAAADLLERRWFAAFKAASAVRTECEALLEEMELVETAWNRARARLAELEELRDALGDQLAELDVEQHRRRVNTTEQVMTAA